MLSPQLLFCAALLAAAAEAFSPAAPLALRAAKPAALASTRSAGLGRVVAPMARAPPRRASHALAMAVSLPADTPLKVGIAGKESRLHIPIIAGASRRWPLCRWPQAYRSGRCSLPAAPRRACVACTHGARTVRHGHRRDGCSRQGDRGCSRKARCVLCARLCHACTFLRSAAAVMPDAPEHSAGYSRACHTCPDHKCTRFRYTLFVFRHLAQKQNHRIRLQTADSIAQIGVLDAGFPVKELKLFGSARSAGTKVQTKWGEVVEHAACRGCLARVHTRNLIRYHCDISMNFGATLSVSH